jgi:hypothetical protein
MDYEKNVYAGRIKRFYRKIHTYPNFKQGANVIEPDSIRFNFKKKALIWNSRSDQGNLKSRPKSLKRERFRLLF